MELLAGEYLTWLKRFLPYRYGIPQAQTFRKVFRLLKPDILERCFASWIASLQEIVRGVVAVDGKTLRGSKKAADGKSALHLLSACACATDAGHGRVEARTIRAAVGLKSAIPIGKICAASPPSRQSGSTRRLAG